MEVGIAALGAVVPAAATLAFATWYRFKSYRPLAFSADTPFHQRVIKNLPELNQRMWTTPWLPFAWMQMIYNYLPLNRHKSDIKVKYKREIVPVLALREGFEDGQIALDWVQSHSRLAPGSPIVLVLHGMLGSSESVYIRELVDTLMYSQTAFRIVVMNNRGCGGTPLIGRQTASPSYTDDLAQAVEHIIARYPCAPIYAVGYSLGAALATLYASQTADMCPLKGIVAVSNMFNLHIDEVNLSISGKCMSRLMAHFFMQEHRHMVPVEQGFQPKTFSEALNETMVPLFHHADLWDMCQQGSTYNRMHSIAVPYLALNAIDDPVARVECVPVAAVETNTNLMFVIAPAGGHSMNAHVNLWPHSWAPNLMRSYLECLDQSHQESGSNAIPGQ